MSDGRKVLRLFSTNLQMQHLPTGKCCLTLTSIAHIDDHTDWELWRGKLTGIDGLPIYESPGILEETIAVLQSDLETERQRYADLQREFETFKMLSQATAQDLGEALTRQAAEVQRLRGLELELNRLAGGPGRVVR